MSGLVTDIEGLREMVGEALGSDLTGVSSSSAESAVPAFALSSVSVGTVNSDSSFP